MTDDDDKRINQKQHNTTQHNTMKIHSLAFIMLDTRTHVDVHVHTNIFKT